MPPERYRVRSVALDTIARKARATGDPVALEALVDVRAALKAVTEANKKAAGGQTSPLILGVGASGVKEVLDWLWSTGLEHTRPTLYEFMHLEPVDAAIMAIISGCFICIGRR